MLQNILVSVLVWNELGYIKAKTAYCGYEYQFGTVWPARWVYSVSTVDVSVEPAHSPHRKSKLNNHMYFECFVLVWYLSILPLSSMVTVLAL